MKMQYTDYPIEECAAAAFEKVQRGATIYQKWTCAHCGSRQTMDEPNKFFRAGICEECKGQSPIVKCNYMLHMQIGRR